MGVLQALFNLDALAGFNCLPKDNNVPYWRVEGLVTASFIIVHILPDHPPVLQIERFLAKDLIRVDQPVEYKAVSVLADMSVQEEAVVSLTRE